ncbi:AraC family transcriptional regulator [Pseudonocardia sp. KRD291]|uniref:helix-turn-helix domain-containing protein n=1 Tax=Pseudonocardia sp. KRD291 TaxID=2792007 RepID=UPI001C49FD3B|nr:helix-turn-helix transcriptional regulator [Pseudonocardia sp. KRD291]MBW0102730.1 helix-turn-helix transcriptional regulator [Pseudonocardia sp. KRD291]
MRALAVVVPDDPDGRPVGGVACVMEPGDVFDAHAHPPHQLAWCSRGEVDVRIGHELWPVSPDRALWIPGGARHAVRARRWSVFRSVYFRPWYAPDGPGDPLLVDASPLLRELIRHIGDARLSETEREHAGRVVRDLVRSSPTGEAPVVLPADPRALQVARGILARPADDRGLAEWGREVGASVRTLSRLFRQETGLSFVQWRARARLTASVSHLRAGLPVGAVAHLVGYSDVSSYVAAFRRAFHCTPRRYRARMAAGPQFVAADHDSPPGHVVRLPSLR